MDGRVDRAHVRRLVLIVLVVAIATIVALLLVGSDDADAPEGGVPPVVRVLDAHRDR